MSTWDSLRDLLAEELEREGIEDAARLARHYVDDVARAARLEGFSPQIEDFERAATAASRLAVGEPLAYVTGVVHFYGRRLAVNPSVLIPRPETEELVRWILEREGAAPLSVADLCTGSGCIAVALAAERASWRVLAVDNDPEALEVARANVRAQGVADRVRCERHDVITDERYLGDGAAWDIIVSNPPYIPDEDWYRVDPAVAAFEPHQALRVPDATPLMFYEQIADTARAHLHPGGRLYFECNDRYVGQVSALLSAMGFTGVEILLDMQGKPRHVRGGRAR